MDRRNKSVKPVSEKEYSKYLDSDRDPFDMVLEDVFVVKRMEKEGKGERSVRVQVSVDSESGKEYLDLYGMSEEALKEIEDSLSRPVPIRIHKLRRPTRDEIGHWLSEAPWRKMPWERTEEIPYESKKRR